MSGWALPDRSSVWHWVTGTATLTYRRAACGLIVRIVNEPVGLVAVPPKATVCHACLAIAPADRHVG